MGKNNNGGYRWPRKGFTKDMLDEIHRDHLKRMGKRKERANNTKEGDQKNAKEHGAENGHHQQKEEEKGWKEEEGPSGAPKEGGKSGKEGGHAKMRKKTIRLDDRSMPPPKPNTVLRRTRGEIVPMVMPRSNYKRRVNRKLSTLPSTITRRMRRDEKYGGGSWRRRYRQEEEDEFDPTDYW